MLSSSHIRRSFSQLVSNFVNSKYVEAYKALLLPELKKFDLGEVEATKIIENVTNRTNLELEPHILSSELALSTVEVVSKMKSKEVGIQIAENTLLNSQIFVTTTNRVGMKISWNKQKYVNKFAKDFCKDHSKALDASYNEDNTTVTVKKCFYADFFKEKGLPEITPIFCKAEKAIFDSATSPPKITFNGMDKTIAKGNDSCTLDFVFKN